MLSSSELGINPRYACWRISRGLDLREAVMPVRWSGEPLVQDGAHQLPASIVFSQWITSQWGEWAAELGFRDSWGYTSHRLALASGRTHDEFDEWLQRKWALKEKYDAHQAREHALSW